MLELAALVNPSAATQPEPQQQAGAANLSASLKSDASSNRSSGREPSRQHHPGTSSQQRPASAGARSKQPQPTSTHSPTHTTARPQTAATHKYSPHHTPGTPSSTMSSTKIATSPSPTSTQRSPSQAPRGSPQAAPPSPPSRPATAPRAATSTLSTTPGAPARAQPGQLQQGEPSGGLLGSTSGSRHQAHEASEQYYEKYRWGAHGGPHAAEADVQHSTTMGSTARHTGRAWRLPSLGWARSGIACGIACGSACA